MVTGNANPEKESFLLVLFRFGEDLTSEQRYTNWEQPFSGYFSEPRMEVQLPSNTGTMDKQTVRIGLPLDSFTSITSAPNAVSPIYVRITEVTRSLEVGGQNTVKVVFNGRIDNTVQNFQGRSEWVGYFCLPRKARLDFPLTPPTSDACPWSVYKSPCGAVQSSFQVDAEIDSFDGLEVTATNANIAAKATGDDRYWRRGFMEKNGLRITIRDYDGSVDTTKFLMSDPIPTDWVGGTGDISFVAGCDKSIGTCRSRFSQEDNFGGIGYAMQPYNPNWESPQ